VEAEDFTIAALHHDLKRCCNYEDIKNAPWVTESFIHQQALYIALTSNPKLLDQLCRSLLLDEIDKLLDNGYSEDRFFGVLEETALKLPTPHKEYFQSLMSDDPAKNLFAENVENVVSRFREAI